MKIQYASDLHLDMAANRRYMQIIPFEVTGDVLVLAGDVGNLCDVTSPCPKFWEWASANYREVLVVPGNHDYFHNCDLRAYGDSWSREILHNVHYYQNRVVCIDNVDFVLSTLWSHIDEEHKEVIHREMPDFRQIMYGDRRFTPADFNAEHEKCLAFIKKSVAESTAEHIVVVTHHLPSLAVVAPEHVGSLLNSAFATELGDFITDSRIDAWIFGHSHNNKEAIIGNTRLTCNQLGYVYYRENFRGFDGRKFFEV